MFKIQQDRYVVRTRCYQVMELCTWKPTCLAIRHHCLIQMNSYVPVTSLFIIICPWYAPEPNIMHLAVGQRLTKVDHLLLKPPLSREVLEHPHSFIKIPNKQPQRLREGLNPFQKLSHYMFVMRTRFTIHKHGTPSRMVIAIPYEGVDVVQTIQ
jgi:hypothetical protein